MHLSRILQALRDLEADHRLRVPDDDLLALRLLQIHGEQFIDAATNDYLGLGRNVSRETVPSSPGPGYPPDVSRETVVDLLAPAPGSGASRLLFGSSPEHLAVEREVAEWLKVPAALLFSSGYAANTGALGALISPEDAVFSDALNHASLIDGIRLSRAKPIVFEHLNLDALEEGLRTAKDAPARWVVVESYYSMDGDGPDLVRLRHICDQYDAALYVDEAHSVGTFGPEGAGLCSAAGVQADVLVAAFGKAVGSSGACVVGSENLRAWLWNRARSFVYSTAPSPAHCASLLRQIRRTRQAEDARRALARLSTKVRAALESAGISLVSGSHGPVLGIVVGSERAALRVADGLQTDGILAAAIRPPTVPEGECRLRLILSADLTEVERARLVAAVVLRVSALEREDRDD